MIKLRKDLAHQVLLRINTAALIDRDGRISHQDNWNHNHFRVMSALARIERPKKEIDRLEFEGLWIVTGDLRLGVRRHGGCHFRWDPHLRDA
jgi:hypothetical protein